MFVAENLPGRSYPPFHFNMFHYIFHYFCSYRKKKTKNSQSEYPWTSTTIKCPSTVSNANNESGQSIGGRIFEDYERRCQVQTLLTEQKLVINSDWVKIITVLWGQRSILCALSVAFTVTLIFNRIEKEQIKRWSGSQPLWRVGYRILFLIKQRNTLFKFRYVLKYFHYYNKNRRNDTISAC